MLSIMFPFRALLEVGFIENHSAVLCFVGRDENAGSSAAATCAGERSLER